MTRSYLSSALLLGFALVAGGCGDEDQKASRIETAAVERRTITVDAQANGVIEPINVVEIKSKASGIITRMSVETGDPVKPGDLLAQIDTRDVQNQYNQAEADLEAANARLQVAVAQKRRSDDMFGQRVITAQEHETAALDYANAQAQMVRARASLDLAKQRLEDATVSAPVAGTITFTIDGAAVESVVPVVFFDADGDGQLDLDANNRPAAAEAAPPPHSPARHHGLPLAHGRRGRRVPHLLRAPRAGAGRTMRAARAGNPGGCAPAMRSAAPWPRARPRYRRRGGPGGWSHGTA